MNATTTTTTPSNMLTSVHSTCTAIQRRTISSFCTIVDPLWYRLLSKLRWNKCLDTIWLGSRDEPNLHVALWHLKCSMLHPSSSPQDPLASFDLSVDVIHPHSQCMRILSSGLETLALGHASTSDIVSSSAPFVSLADSQSPCFARTSCKPADGAMSRSTRA